MTPQLRPAALQVLVQQARDLARSKQRDAPVIAVQSRQPWGGGDTVAIGEESIPVLTVDSDLALREVLVQADEDGQPRVILVPWDVTGIAMDVRSRLCRQTVHHADLWETVSTLFSASRIDPAVGDRVLAELLVEYAPAERYSPTPGGVLDRETVWRAIHRHVLQCEVERPDLAQLLVWTTEDGATARYEALSTEVKDRIREHHRRTNGPAAELFWRWLDVGQGARALPLGVACEVIYATKIPNPQGEIRIQTELKEHQDLLTPEVGTVWAQAARDAMAELESIDAGRAEHWLKNADTLLANLKIEDVAYASSVSKKGYLQRVDRLATAIHVFAQDPGEESFAEVEARLADARDHRRFRMMPDRVWRLEMAERLARWLHSKPAELPSSFEAAVREYLAERSWVDRARNAIVTGDGISALSEALVALEARAFEEQVQFAERFASLLPTSTPDASCVVPIENVLKRVVAPIASLKKPVLLLVLDGGSWAVVRDLVDDIEAQHLGRRLAPEDDLQEITALTTVPSATQFSRASLLCGALRKGGQSTEGKGFKGNGALTAASTSSHPPVLFHKGDLTEGGGGGVAKTVLTEIANEKRRIVGVVVNAIDDHLAKTDQLTLHWKLGTITPLEQLLRAAFEADRYVVIASDHGHVLHRRSSTEKNEDAGERWRKSPPGPADGERSLQGPRVFGAGEEKPGGGEIIVPWDESVHYGSSRTGYHGGIAPAEILAPIVVLGSNEPKGWVHHTAPEPEWWGGTAESAASTGDSPKATTTEKGADKKPADSVAPKKQASVAPITVGGFEAFLESDLFEQQRKAVGRLAPPPELVALALEVLHAEGGTLTEAAFAARVKKPSSRVPGMIRQLQRILNIEGYEVLRYDTDQNRVQLDVALLRQQFELE